MANEILSTPNIYLGMRGPCDRVHRISSFGRNGPGSRMTCQYCGSTAVLVDSIMIYKTRSFGHAWVCSRYPSCDSYVGCHPGTHKPLGILANQELRTLKREVHLRFDRLWKLKMMREKCRQRVARQTGYLWLACKMGLSEAECHIGKFNEEKCRQALKILAELKK
jgi:hypothetical protein